MLLCFVASSQVSGKGCEIRFVWPCMQQQHLTHEVFFFHTWHSSW